MKLRVPVLLLLAFGVLVVPAPAEAAACSGAGGVTVLVQYADGPTQVGCASGDPDSGYAALQAAGFKLTYAHGNGAGAICQINKYPAMDVECPSMPAAPNYWAYFQGVPGGSWHYSTVGGGSYDPRPGSVEGWCFGCSENEPPHTKPPGSAAVAPTPHPIPTKRPTRNPSHPTPSAAPTSTSATVTATPPSASATSSAGTVLTGPEVTPTPAYAEPGPVEGADAPAEDHGLSWIWGVVLVGVLAAAGGATAVIRRRS